MCWGRGGVLVWLESNQIALQNGLLGRTGGRRKLCMVIGEVLKSSYGEGVSKVTFFCWGDLFLLGELTHLGTMFTHCFGQSVQHFSLEQFISFFWFFPWDYIDWSSKNWQSLIFTEIFFCLGKKSFNRTFFLKILSIVFSERRTSVILDFPSQIPCVAKFWFLSYHPRCS